MALLPYPVVAHEDDSRADDLQPLLRQVTVESTYQRLKTVVTMQRCKGRITTGSRPSIGKPGTANTSINRGLKCVQRRNRIPLQRQ